ncbi:hypothetical protein [Hyalangium rubrum]|uniref:Lipoprotein n=1 Tax=Hyalangium rubrum TaxID=3103134 RepID=A0ABU5HDQ8_9BACT|nr:hypothetical protein [Hyalangium sp. s54d21]MDY7231491.1 hypothetical protein [Hyalangium sp. s54d21]
MKRLSVVLLVLVAAGCKSHTQVAPDDRATLEQTLTGPDADRFLRVSFYVTPFFGDASRRLLTPYPPEDVDMLNDRLGKPINPGAVEATLAAGAKARIRKVEFPTAWVVAERVLYTPRTWPWVYVDVEGAPPGPPLVLVLPPHHKTREEFLAEVERSLAVQDLAPRIAAFNEQVREAVRQKKAVTGMPSEALEMAWGYPETIKRTLEGTTRNEEWIYPRGRRRAYLSDGVLVRVEEGAPPAAPK